MSQDQDNRTTGSKKTWDTCVLLIVSQEKLCVQETVKNQHIPVPESTLQVY